MNSSPVLILARNTLICCAIIAAYGWVSVDDWEAELAQEQQLQQQQAQAREQQRQLEQLAQEQEFEPDWNQVEPETPIKAATRHVKQAAVKAKKQVKRAVKP